MDIRKATDNDSEAIHDLIAAVAPTCQQDFGPHGLENFLAPNTVEKIQERIQNEDYFSLLCEFENHIVGIITIKNCQEVNQLFVHPVYQRQGIASKLWQQAYAMIKHNAQANEITVRSSTMGVSVYESFGFKRVGEKNCLNDINYYYLSLNLDKI